MSYTDNFSLEDHNRADRWAKELIARRGVTSLADLSESDLEDFRYTANLHVTDAAFQLLRCRFFEAKKMPFRIGEIVQCGSAFLISVALTK